MLDVLKKSLAVRQSAEDAAADIHALMVAAERAVTSVLGGEHTQRKVGSGEKFWQFRNYQTGDRPQDIDWRQSAKADDVQIRQKEWQTPQTTVLWCSQSAGMNYSSDASIPTKADAAKILTMALALLMTRAGDQVGLFGMPRRGRSKSTLQNMATSLCDPRHSVTPLPDIASFTTPRNAALVQIGDFLDDPARIEPVFEALSAHNKNGLVIQILDPAEIELPYAGRVIFEDPADRSRQLVNHVSSIREAYQARIQNHLKQIEALTHDHHWSYLLHRTDTPLKNTLATIWSMISHHNAELR